MLLYDPSMTGLGGSDGSGPWDTTTPIWAAVGGGGDVIYPNSAADLTTAVFGFNTGSAAYTVTLATNVVASEVLVETAGPGASYTFNGNGNTLTATASGSDNGLDVDGGNLTLTDGTFALGQLSNQASTGFIGSAVVAGGGVLTVGPGSVLAASRIFGDGSAGSVVRFDGGTFQPLANFNTAAGAFAQLTGVANVYVAAGGLTVDTSRLVADRSSSAILYQNLQHDPSVAGIDGGLTKVGGTVLYLGFNSATLFSYNGPTTVSVGANIGTNTSLVVLYSTANTATTGPFPNTQFAVNAGSEVNVDEPNGLAGATGTTPVALNGGVLATFDGLSVHLGSVTSAGGELYSFAATNASTGVVTNTGTFTFGSGSELHATAAPTPANPVTATFAESAFLTFEAGSDVRADAGAELDVFSNLVDDANGPGQLTVNGPGAVLLAGGSVNTYTGSTTVNAGGLLVNYYNTSTDVPSRITDSKTIAVAAGGTFNNSGLLASLPNVTVAGTVLFAAYPGQTAAEVTRVNSLSITGASATNPSANGLVTLAASTPSLPRTLLVTGSLTLAGTTNAWLGRLNLSNDDLDVQNGGSAGSPQANLATVTNQIATGYNAGSFTGNGIYSSTAAANAARNTTVGVALNNAGNGTRLFGSGTAAGLFDGTDPAATDVLVRYTYYGDANLDGKVDGQDYARTDAGFLSKGALTGWYNGDFNYDGKIDASDYTLIDNAFNTQGSALTPTVILGGAGGNADFAAGNSPSPPQTADPALDGSDSVYFGGGLAAASTDEIAPVVGTAAVPEPATGAVVGTAAVLFAGRRRRLA